MIEAYVHATDLDLRRSYRAQTTHHKAAKNTKDFLFFVSCVAVW